MRTEFDEWGRLLRRVRVVQILGVDTAYTENFTTGAMEMEVTKGIAEIPDGYFQEYNGSWLPYRAGMVAMGRPIGPWHYFANGTVIKTLNIGEHGRPEGECIEYHLNGAKHWVGSYGIRRFNALECPDCPPNIPGYGKRIERTTNVPIGEWREWDDAGHLIQVVTYSWVED